jgi:hypothetical protein
MNQHSIQRFQSGRIYRSEYVLAVANPKGKAISVLLSKLFSSLCERLGLIGDQSISEFFKKAFKTLRSDGYLKFERELNFWKRSLGLRRYFKGLYYQPPPLTRSKIIDVGS